MDQEGVPGGGARRGDQDGWGRAGSGRPCRTGATVTGRPGREAPLGRAGRAGRAGGPGPGRAGAVRAGDSF